jgi:predicted nucleotidyltransferase
MHPEINSTLWETTIMSSDEPLWKRTLKEAMAAASMLVSEDMRKDFLIVGGSALVRYGSDRRTKDIDIAITPTTLNAFNEAASKDSRFSLHADETWVYTCQGQGIERLQVPIEFLAMGGGIVPKLRGMTLTPMLGARAYYSSIQVHVTTKFSAIWVASLPDMAVMKAQASLNREEDHDYGDLLYVLSEMARREQTLGGYGIKKSGMKAIESAVAGDDEGQELLLRVR